MRFTVGSGSLSGLAGTCGTGLAMALPSQNWIGYGIIFFGVCIFLLDVKVERNHVEIGGPLSIKLRSRKMLAQSGMFVGILIFLTSLYFYYWPDRSTLLRSLRGSKITSVVFRRPVGSRIDDPSIFDSIDLDRRLVALESVIDIYKDQYRPALIAVLPLKNIITEISPVNLKVATEGISVFDNALRKGATQEAAIAYGAKDLREFDDLLNDPSGIMSPQLGGQGAELLPTLQSLADGKSDFQTSTINLYGPAWISSLDRIGKYITDNLRRYQDRYNYLKKIRQSM